MNTRILLMFAAIAAVLGLGTADIVGIQPASAQSFTFGDVSNIQTSDQGDCNFVCINSQNNQQGQNQNDQEN